MGKIFKAALRLADNLSPHMLFGGVQLSIQPNSRLSLGIIYEDEDLFVINKPPGVPSQPGLKHQRDTVLNGAFARHGARLQNLGKRRDFGLLHRLDRPSSGLLIIALSPEAYDVLRIAFKERKIEKRYLALVQGRLRPPKGVLQSLLRVSREGGRKRALLASGPGAKEAITHYRTLAQSGGLSLLECRLETGRLHQIRAHMAWRRCPIVGDREYGRGTEISRNFARLTRRAIFLHAAQLNFKHPVNGRGLRLRAPLPESHQSFLEGQGLRWRSG